MSVGVRHREWSLSGRLIGWKIRECQTRKEVTPRAWCLPNTVTYKSKGLIEREEKGAGSTGKGIKQRKHLLSLRLLTGRAGCTDMHTRTHTHNRPLTVSSLSGFVDVFLEPARLMVRLASSNWWEKECYIASRVAAHLLMRHSERQFVAPLHQSPLSILCIYGCIVRMCLRWSSFKAKHKAHFLVRMRHSPCPTTHTHTHI